MVLVTDGETTAGDVVAESLADQMVALQQRVSTANVPGSLDGLFAYHVLHRRPVSAFIWDVSPLTNRWLERNIDRLSNAPQLAALGYGLTYFTPSANIEAGERLAAGLQGLMRRDPYPTDGITFVQDPRQLIGIALAADVVRHELPQVAGWLRGVLQDERLGGRGGRHDTVHRHVRSVLLDEVSVLPNPTAFAELVDLALVHWVATAESVRLPDPAHDLRTVQRRIMIGLLQTRATDLSVPGAALVLAAAGHIIDASVDGAVLGRSHVGVVLRRFQPAMRRWRWDDPAKIKEAIRWPITSEREVQDIVWALLRAVFDDLVDEEPLRKVGHSSYRSDFGLPQLGVLIEVKYVRSAAEFKKVEKEVYEDSVTYLKDRGTYKKIVVFIYDASASVQEHATTSAALLDLDNVIDVVIASRPSQLPPPGSDQAQPPPSQPKPDRARRKRTS